MEKAILFEHNERAYELLNESLKKNKCTTINHATGTGKSFIALKFFYENRDKKYLYIAPTYPIIEQLFADCYKIGLTPEDINIDTMIYRNLLTLDMDELYEKYDGIFFDEYHRTGARKTYKQIKQLKLKLQESDDSKIFVGLTATPIRYLDSERNMTEEIFDGNVASSISLAQAMLEGLLPVPLYINSKIACMDELNKTRKRVARLSPTKEKGQLERKILQIEKKINSGTSHIEMINHYIKEKNGKYIVFCNTIRSLEKTYEVIDTWFSDLGKIKKYKVYSNQTDDENKANGLKSRNSRQVNQDNLDRFNNDKEGISVLLCVDVLNEGVHVDGIDGVILLRRTMSPIIYFQQIGRALSFSGRKKQIKIFDLVNNFGNHIAIDLVYKEFQEEMKKLIELYPEKAKQYQEALDRFKIMDETREILEELNQINEQVTPEKIIYSKLSYSIDLLKEKIEDEGEAFRIFGDLDSQRAYTTISKYYKYIDNAQFKQLLNLGIILPKNLSMTYEERLEMLDGFDSIREKEKVDNDIFIERFIEFIEENGRKPENNSEDIEEIHLSERYTKYILYVSDEQKERLKTCMKNNNIEYEAWEKVVLGEKINGKDVEKIIELSNSYLENNRALPEYMQNVVTSIIFNYNIKQNVELFSILEKSEEIENNIRRQIEQERIKNISEILTSLEENASLSEKELKEKGILGRIFNLSKADRSYITRKFSASKRMQYKKIVSSTDGTDLLIFCRKMKNIKSDEFDEYFSIIEKEQEVCVTLKGIIEFMAKNGGKMPNSESDNELERKLAIKLEEYVEDGSISEKFTDLEKDMQSQWYSPEKIMNSIIYENFKESNIKMIILKNIEFFNRNGRRALRNSQDEEERIIATEYEEKCIAGLGQDKIAVLNRIFNNKKSIQKTCEVYAKNVNSNKKERI